MPRRHDIDALRLIAFSLLILYHVGMVYVADWDFHVKSTHQWEWLQWPMMFTNVWRMSLIFLISGLALGFARPGRALVHSGLSRSWRLLIPLLFGMLATVPVQAYCEALANGAIEPGFPTFMVRYLQLKPWTQGGFTGAENGVTWNHLWYLAYLWCYTIVLMAVIALYRCLPSALQTTVHTLPTSWRSWPLLLLPPVYFFVLFFWLAPRFPPTHALTDDWFAHAQYLPLFFFGYAVAGRSGFWKSVQRIFPLALLLALMAAGVHLGLHLLRSVVPAECWFALSCLSRAVYLWTALLGLLGLAQSLLNRPFRWLPYANEAIYPWYILHQSLIVPLAFYIAPLSLPGWLEAALVLSGTLAGCALLHECLIRRSAWLRPVFGLKRQTGGVTPRGIDAR